MPPAGPLYPLGACLGDSVSYKNDAWIDNCINQDIFQKGMGGGRDGLFRAGSNTLVLFLQDQIFSRK